MTNGFIDSVDRVRFLLRLEHRVVHLLQNISLAPLETETYDCDPGLGDGVELHQRAVWRLVGPLL